MVKEKKEEQEVEAVDVQVQATNESPTAIKEQEDAMMLMLRAKNLYQLAVENRRKYDWEWLVRNLYIRGYHFARYNRSSNTVTFSSRTGVRIPINLIAAHMRGVRNQVTSFQPKWEVLPKVTSESAFENAR